MTTVRYTRSEWREHFSPNEVVLNHKTLTAVPYSEIETIYYPLISLIEKWRKSNADRVQSLTQFFGITHVRKTPFLIGIAGSVAAGKSTTSKVIADLLKATSADLKVEIISTDHFLYPNAELQTRGIMNRKGFPESYDWALIHQVLSDLKNGVEVVHTPVYSHAVYDITGETALLNCPDIVILEGINVLQAGIGFRPISDWLDLKIYVDAEESFVFNWYWKRVQNLVETAGSDPSSYFSQFQNMDQEALFAFAKRIWRDINSVNLKEYILPSRERADLILKKDESHAIQEIICHLTNF